MLRLSKLDSSSMNEPLTNHILWNRSLSGYLFRLDCGLDRPTLAFLNWDTHRRSNELRGGRRRRRRRRRHKPTSLLFWLFNTTACVNVFSFPDIFSFHRNTLSNLSLSPIIPSLYSNFCWPFIYSTCTDRCSLLLSDPIYYVYIRPVAGRALGGGVIALPSFVLGCPALNRWLPRDLCPLPLPLLLVLLRFQGHLNSNPTSRKERRSGDLGAIGAPLGTKEIRIFGVPSPLPRLSLVFPVF